MKRLTAALSVSVCLAATACDPEPKGEPDADPADAAPIGDAPIVPDAGAPDAGECASPPCEETVAIFPVSTTRDLDMLFVIDNSGSMAEEQASLAANFHRFVDTLEAMEGGLPNLHLGVTSTNLGAGPFNISGCQDGGDKGILQSAPRGACTPPSGAFISDIAEPGGERTRNYTGTLDEVFSCIARLGIDGCGFEQQLEAMRRALNDSNPENAGFLREHAHLAVVFVTDEDDCSTEDTNMFDTSQNSIDDPLGPLSSFRCYEFGVECDPDEPRAFGAKSSCEPRADSTYMFGVDQYVDFLKGLKSSPSMITVAGIVGNPTPVIVGSDFEGGPRLEPSCQSASGEAAPAVRLNAFLQQFPARSTITTICNEDLSDALTLVANLVTQTLQGRCLAGNLHDTDPIAPGVQAQCEVVDSIPGGTETELPVCDNASAPQSSTNLPCHLIGPDETCTTGESGLAVSVYRGDVSPPPELEVIVRCLVD